MAKIPCLICGSLNCMYIASPDSTSLKCDDCGGLRIAAYAFVQKLQTKNERLKKALLGHRWDLHNGSARPCATCRESAEALDLKVPNRCAKERWDREALKEGE